jgi:hypothetical protein
LAGVASVAGTAFFGYGVWAFRSPPAQPASSSSGVNSLIDLLVMGARLLGGLFGAFAKAGQFFFTVATVFCALVLVFSITLWLVANGLATHHTWARIISMLVSGALLLICALTLMSGPRGPALAIVLALTAAFAYSLWVFWRRFV